MRCKTTTLLAILALLSVAVPSGQDHVAAQQSPSNSVFLIWVVAQENLRYRVLRIGTGFFISPSGLALTAAHVIYPVIEEPKKYELVAIVGRDFYGASLICATPLAADYLKGKARYDSDEPRRDIAEIQLKIPHLPFDRLQYSGTPVALAHNGPLPEFLALKLSNDIEVGDTIRILGFGHQQNIYAPYQWSASGTVTRLGSAQDATPLVAFTFVRSAQPGNSGSPVLNAKDQVVGMYNWASPTRTEGTAIASNALLNPCKV